MPCEMANNAQQAERKNRQSLDELMPILYEELRRLAAACLRSERSGHTLQPTALVHEVYLRLADQENVAWANRAHVLGIAAQMMRRVLINYANHRNAAKGAGNLVRVPLTDAVAAGSVTDVSILQLERALQELERLDPAQARIVELRFYGGLTTGEVASVLDVSTATVERKWAMARLWLLRRIDEAARQ